MEGRACRGGRVFLLQNKTQQVKIFSVVVFKIVRRDKGGFLFPGCFCHDLSTNVLLQLTLGKKNYKDSLSLSTVIK